MGQHRIEFDVDFGLAFKESDIKKQAEKHKEKILKSIQNGEPLEMKFNVKNAIDDNGNPIDEASLKRFTAKYEKQVNSVLKNMMNSFSDKAMDQMSSKITEQLSSTIEELFASMSTAMINGIEDMRNDIISALGSKPINIEGSDIVNIDAKSVEGELKQSSKNIKKASNKFIDEVHKAYAELKQAEKEERAAKKKTDSDIAIDGTVFNDETIQKMQLDEKKVEKVLKELGLKFQKAYDEYLDIDDEDDGEETQKLLKNLENRQKAIATVISRFNNNSKYITPDLFGEFGEDYIIGISDFADETSAAIRKAAEQNVADKQAYYDMLQQDPKFKSLALDKTNMNVDKDGAKARLKLEPTVNATKFIKDVFNAIESISKHLKPIEIPIKPEPESIGGFLEDIRESLINNPFDIEINKENIAEQIKEAAKSINVDLGATISNVNTNGAQIISKPITSPLPSSVPVKSISDDEMEMYEAWAEIGNSSDVLSADDLEFFKGLVTGTTNETQKLDEAIEEVGTSFEDTAQKTEVVKKTVQEIADALNRGQHIEIVDNQVIKDLDDKLEVYENVLGDLRRKKDITTTSKPLDGGLKESELLKKKDKTDEDKKRLELLKQERKQRNAIRNEWVKLEPTLQNINDAQARIDGSSEYSKQLKELASLRSTKHLSKSQQERRVELEKQEKSLLDQRKQDELLIQNEKERLEIAKQTSSYFGKMSNSTLLDLQKDIHGELSAKKLIDKATTNRSNEINSSYFSEEYREKYKKSKESVAQGSGKRLSPLMQEKRHLEDTANLWQNVNSLVEDNGKEKALGSINYELQQVNKEIGITQSKLVIAEQKLKNGTYTPSRYAEVEQELKKEKGLLETRRKELNKSANIIKYNSEEEIKAKANEHKVNLDLFNKDIAAEETRNRRIDQLRYKDLQSFSKYQVEYNKQQERRSKQKSYDDQISSVMPKIDTVGKTEKQIKEARHTALNHVLDELGIKDEYWSNDKAIKKYDGQLKNVEADLNEILKLTQEINNLNDELSQDGLSSDVVNSKKQELSGKRLALESLIQRTGWNDNDILGYQSMQNYLNSIESKSTTSVSKKADISQFNKDANSVKEIVENISIELDKVKKENDELFASVETSERKLTSIKEGISAKHQDDAKKILDQINELREQRKLLKAEIANTADEIEKEQKKIELGRINKRLKGLEYYYDQANNPALLQSKIDSEYNAQTRTIQQQVNAKKSQILVNNEYIKSLEDIKKEQEEIRRIQEPTSQELSTDKRKVNSQYKKEIAKIDSSINQLEDEVSKAQSELDIVSQSAGKSLEKINEELERETENLKNIQNVEKGNTSESKHSSIYQEYLDAQKPIQENIKQASKELATNNKKQEEAQKKINNLMESYGVETEEQLRTELERRKVFQEIISLQEKINRRIPLARGGNKNAIKDIDSYKSQIDNMSAQLGFNNEDLQKFILLKNNVSSIQDKINNNNRNSKIVNLEHSIAERINKGEGNTDEVKNLQIAIEKLVKDDKNEQELLKLKSELKNIESEMLSIIDRIGKKNAEDYFKVLNSSNDYTNIINDVDSFSETKHKIEEENNVLNSSIDANEKVLQKSNAEYMLKLSQALTEETTQYNNELTKSGDLTEEAENHLLNMVRYMDEIENVSGKEITFSDYGINSKTFNMMNQILKENQEMDSNIAKSEANYEVKQQQKVKSQEQIVAALKKQKEEQEMHIKSAQKELEQKQKALELAKQQKVEEEERHKAEVAAIDEQRRLMKERIKSSEQTSSVSPTDSGAQEQVVQLDKLEEELKEVNVEAEKASDAISQVNQTNISSEPIKDTFDNQVYSDKDIVLETDAIKNSQEELKDTVKEVNAELDEQAHPETTTLPPSPIVEQQQEARKEVVKTNEVLQDQIALAIQNAHVSIAEGAHVNISGDVKIDESQWSGIDKITNSAEELLNVVKNIYLSISRGTPQVDSQLNAVQAPIENISAQIQQVEGAVGQADVQLKSFGNSIKAVSTGNLDLGKKEFEDVQEAVEAMNKALEGNKTLSKIQSSGDITAKYYKEVDDDNNVQSFVKFNTVFKDTNGQVIKATYVYDVLNKKLSEADQITAKVSDKFTQQEKAMKLAGSQLNYYTSQLDKLLIKYDTFDIKDFGINDDGNLFANVGTRAEQIYDVISGNTKRSIKDVILYRQEVEEAFKILKRNAENGLYTEETFKGATDNFNKMVANFESKMNTVNRNMNTATEKNARSLLGKWQNELDSQISWLYDGDGSIRKDTSILNSNGLANIEKYKQALKELKILYASYVEQGEYFTESQVLAWKTQMQTISDIKKEIDGNASKKYVNGKGYSIDGLSIDSSMFNELSNNSTYARQVLSELAQEINGVEVEILELSKDNKTLTYSFKDTNKNIQTCKLSIDDFGKTVRNTVTKSSQHVGLFSKIFGSLKDKLIQITKYVSAYEIFYKAVNAIRSGIEVVKELDLAMTEMKKVTNESQQALDTFAKSTHKTAQEIGSTASIIQNSAADWMRLGYSIKEAAGLAKNTSILMNVSEFEDIGTATESMVAMIQAFKGEGADVVELSSTLIDKLNNIGNNYSISTSELAESLKRSSGTLIAANNSVDEAIALSVAANALIQDAESTGSALKVISMRIRGTSVKALEEIGEDTEGLIETTSKLQQKVQSLTAVNGKMGVSLLDANGNYRTTYEILQDIADLWNEIGEADIADGQNRQAALLEVLAGENFA